RTSHPSLATPLQSAQPARHVKPQAPAAQLAAAFGGTGHRSPQPPQFAGSASVEVSQPLPMSSSQSSQPSKQKRPQAPPVQTAVAFAAVGHARPHPPQCEGSRLVSTQLAPQVSPAAQPSVHAYPPETA